MPVRNLQILCALTLVCGLCYFQAEHHKVAGKLGTAIQLVKDNYVEEIETNDLYEAAMQGLVSQLDQFSEYIPPSKFSEFQSVIEQQFGGLGILIEGPPAVPQLTVIAPIPGTPAFEAGMQPGDVITHIGEQSTKGLQANDATQLMRGPVGESVDLKIQRLGESQPISLSVRRADIQVDSIYGDRIRADSSWDYFLEEDARIAYIRITLFGERTLLEFQQALDKVRDAAQAVVIDLRFNPGGILPASVHMCDMLVDHGTIVSTRGRHGVIQTEFKANAEVSIDLSVPLVVLVNDQSASASEIMAGCLQDLGRAKIAGSRTYGKGTVQQVFPLEGENTALKFTTARFYRPSGLNIHRTEDMKPSDTWGVSPDPSLELKANDVQELYLNLRWRHRGDPRLMTAPERPPTPAFAGDPQLQMVVKYLQGVLDGKP